MDEIVTAKSGAKATAKMAEELAEEMNLRPLLSPTQVAEMFGCSLASVYRMTHAGVLAHIRIGPEGESVGRICYDPADVAAFIAARKVRIKRTPHWNQRYPIST